MTERKGTTRSGRSVPARSDDGSGIRVTLRCFSHVRDALGTSDVQLTLPTGTTARDLIREVRRLAEGRLDGLPVRVAINQEFVAPDHVLSDGDEAALIPPVQGG